MVFNLYYNDRGIETLDVLSKWAITQLSIMIIYNIYICLLVSKGKVHFE